MVSRQHNFSQTCNRCDFCCCQNARPPITETRKKNIERYLAAQGLRIDRPFTKAAYTFPRETTEGFCVFFEKEHQRCLIHPVKPETCVAGPITFDINLHTGKIEWFLKSKSICPLAGVLYDDKGILETHLRHAKQELRTLVHEIHPEELFVLLQIEEPDAFKVGEDPLNHRIREQLASITH